VLTIRNHISCTSRLLGHHKVLIVLGTSRTSSIGIRSPELLSHFTARFDAENKNWAAMISNSPAFVSKNSDAVGYHRSERVRRDFDTGSGCKSGDASSGTSTDDAFPGSRGATGDNEPRVSVL
jgi:hypothetical protein